MIPDNIYHDVELRVYGKDGQRLPVKARCISNSYGAGTTQIEIVTDIDTARYAEYIRELNSAPSLDGIVRGWPKLNSGEQCEETLQR